MDFGENTTKIVIAIIAAVAGAGILIRFVINRNTRKSNKTEIKGNVVGGDLAGRDIKKKK